MHTSKQLSYFQESLPEFQDDSELLSFFLQGFKPQLAPTFFPQLVITSVILCILVFLGALTTISRLYKKVFWVFKIEHRRNGRLLIFNTTNVFTTFQLFFIGSFEAFLWVVYQESKGRIGPENFLFPVLLPWLPLISGAYLSVQGTYVACEQILTTTNTSNDQPSRSLMPSPVFVNVATFLLPIACTCFAVPFSIVGGFQWRDAYHSFLRLQRLVSSSPSSSPTDEEKALAASVWKQFADSLRTICLGFLIWCVVAVLFTILVVCFGTFLIRALNTHLDECRHNGNATYQQTQTVAAYWPNRTIPENAKETAKQGRMSARAKRVVLSSAIKLILFLGLGILGGASGAVAISAYIAANLYELACKNPRMAQDAISSLLMAMMWLIVVAGTFTFSLISVSAFSPILENYTEKRRRRRGSRSRSRSGSESQSQSQSFSKNSKMNRMMEFLPMKLRIEGSGSAQISGRGGSDSSPSQSRALTDGYELSTLERNTRANSNLNTGQIATFQEEESGLWRESIGGHQIDRASSTKTRPSSHSSESRMLEEGK